MCGILVLRCQVECTKIHYNSTTLKQRFQEVLHEMVVYGYRIHIIAEKRRFWCMKFQKIVMEFYASDMNFAQKYLDI